MSSLFNDLKEGLEEAIEYEKGKKTLRSNRIIIPDSPKSYTDKEIKKIRMKIDCSQAIFAKILNVSIKTVQSWESGARKPNHSALRLLELIEKGLYGPDFYNRKRSQKTLQAVAAHSSRSNKKKK